MKKIIKNQGGFGVVEIILLVVVLGLIGFVGYYAYSQRHKTTSPTQSTQATTNTTKKAQTPSANPNAGYLVIKEWGVKVALTTPINNATYQIVTNNKYLKPSAFLSTATLDASTDCTSYYTKYASPDDPLPTFQYIERFALTDSTSLDEGQTTITAQQAAQQQPNAYKKVGDYVYYYGHGNGMPCQEQTTEQSNAYEKAFSTITKSQ